MREPKQTTEEPILATHLREAAEALQARLWSKEELLRDAHQAVKDGCDIIDLEDLTLQVEQARGALAWAERMATIMVKASEQGGLVDPRIFAEAWKTSKPTAYAASLLHVWQPEDADQAEVEAVAHLAAAAECRLRNAEVRG